MYSSVYNALEKEITTAPKRELAELAIDQGTIPTQINLPKNQIQTSK